MQNHNRRLGFTLIELSLSITFIAVLSLAVVLIIANSISAYHRGMVLNQINTTGMEIVDEMRATIQNAPVISLASMCDVYYEGNKSEECKNSDGVGFVLSRKTGQVLIDKNNAKTEISTPVSGVFCTGNYSFIWNSGYFFSEDSEVKNVGKIKFSYHQNENGKKKVVDYSTNQDIRLLKVKDQDRAVCAAYDLNKNEVNIVEDKYNAVVEDPVEMFSNNTNLAFYDLYAPVPATNATNYNMYYSVSFVLGTLQGGADVTAQGDFCAAPEGKGETSGIENFDYCAINKFNFAAEAVGGEK